MGRPLEVEICFDSLIYRRVQPVTSKLKKKEKKRNKIIHKNFWTKKEENKENSSNKYLDRILTIKGTSN